ncbi:MAG: acyl-CoA dehydrogenase family protein [Actinomycetota bacterium]
MSTINVADFAAEAEVWLKENGTPLPADRDDKMPQPGDELSLAVFHNLSHDEEQSVLDDLTSWQQKKAERGYHAIAWPEEFGGLGLTKQHQRAFNRLEGQYQLPDRHELFSVTTNLIAPTVNHFGTEEQKAQFVAKLLTTELMCAQLFSEPGYGSDLAGLGCRAERDGDEWIINGQKVWSSGAQFAGWGELIARSDVDQPKHKGMTAFLVPLEGEGIEVRPIKQLSGGTSFNEVFFNDFRVPDSLRLGPEGEGWKVALTTLGYERDHSDNKPKGKRPGGDWNDVLATARHHGVTDDPIMRQRLAQIFISQRVQGYNARRAADLAKSGTPGPEGSLGKLLWTEGMTLISDVMADIIGPALTADTGEWATWEWNDHFLGAPGYRIAGGSDEIQRNILGERVLGLPGEPRADKGMAWKDIPK